MTVIPSSDPDAAVDATEPAAALRGWRALPAPLVLGMCLSLISAVASAVQDDYRSPSFMRSIALNFGLLVATRALETYGLVVLGRRQPRLVRIGLYLVIGEMVAGLLLSLAFHVIRMSIELVNLLSLGWGVIGLFGAVGLGLAMWPRRRAMAIGVFLLTLLAPRLLMSAIIAIPSFDLYRASMIKNAISAALSLAVLAWVLVGIAGESPAPAPAQLARGLRQGHYALRTLVVVLLATLILAVGPTSSHAGRELVRFLSIGDLWLGAACVGWLGISLARAGVAPGGEPGAYLLGIAGALVLMCGGSMMYAAIDQSAAWLGDADRWDQTLSSGRTLLLAPLAGTVLAAAIARLAGRTGFDRLRRRATLIAIGFGALFAPVLLMSDRLLLDPSPPVMFVTAGLVVAAGLLLAGLCKAASQAFEHTSGTVPVARVV